MKIFSPMASGNGAHVIHSLLAKEISKYTIHSYNPYWTLFPPALPLLIPKNYHVDIVHTTPEYAHFYKQRENFLCITFHNCVLDTFMVRYSSLAQRIHYKTSLRYFTQKALSSATVVTAVSNYTANIVRDCLDYKGNIQVIYNGIDTELFKPQKTFHPQKKIRVLFSGNLTRRKGANLLPPIADRLDDDIEIFYTSGLRTRNSLPNHPKLKNLGAFSYNQMPSVYQNADILLFPTVREGFGLAAAEAMSCGLPVVGTNCSSLPELIVDGKGGYLCQLENVDEFVDKLNILAKTPDLRFQMGEYNRSRVKKLFTLERMVKEYKNLFANVLDNT